jgi:hypothetical protein
MAIPVMRAKPTSPFVFGMPALGMLPLPEFTEPTHPGAVVTQDRLQLMHLFATTFIATSMYNDAI